MSEMDKVLATVRHLNRQGVRANARTVQLWGELYYTEQWIRCIMRRLAEQGRLMRVGQRRHTAYYAIS